MTNPLAYDTSTDYLPDDCVLKISPSRFHQFINKPYKWFRETILEEEGFTGNTGSVIGTVLHYIAACVAKKEEINKDAIYEYVNSKEDDEYYSAQEVLSNFEQMAHVLVNNYVLPNMEKFLYVEERFFVGIRDGFYVGGTMDLVEGTPEDCMISDYKNYSSKTKPKGISMDHRYQLLVYAYILIQLGFTVSRIRVIYINRNIDGGISDKTGNPLKSYPPELSIFTEVINDESIEFITSQLELCVDACLATDDHPELTHVIWHDPRLKEA